MSGVEFDAYGFPAGSGIFETIKTVDGEVIALARHMRRALSAAERKGFSLPDEEIIREQIVNILKTNVHPIGRLRLCFAPNQFVLSHDLYTEIAEPARLALHHQPTNGDEFVIKTYPYDSRFEILNSAKARGFDEAICINNRGQVTEGAMSNLILRIADQWFTTPLTAGVLPGVIRAIAVEKCGVKVAAITESDLAQVQSALLTSSLKIALAVSAIEDRMLEIGEPLRLLQAEIRAKTQPTSVG